MKFDSLPICGLILFIAIAIPCCAHFEAGSNEEIEPPITASECALKYVGLETVNFALPVLGKAEKVLIKALNESGCFERSILTPIDSVTRTGQAANGFTPAASSGESQIGAAPSLKSGELKLVVILEAVPRGRHPSEHLEVETGAFMLRQVSQMLMLQSFGAFPGYVRVERVLSFEVWQDGQMLKRYQYIRGHHQFAGALGLLLFPLDDTVKLRRDLKLMTRQFLRVAKDDPLLMR